MVGGSAHDSGAVELNDVIVSIDGKDVRGRTAAEVKYILNPK